MKILAGEGYNLVARTRYPLSAAAVVTSSPALATPAFVYDGLLSPPAAAASSALAPQIDLDLCAWDNFGFENALPTPWVLNGGTIATDQKRTGTFSLKGTAAGIPAYVDYFVRPGEWWKFIGYARGDGASIAGFYLINMATGKFWTGTAWGSPTVLGANSTSAFVQYTTTFQVEPYSAILESLAVLRVVLLYVSGGAAVWFDDVAMFPGVNFVGLWHNVPARMHPWVLRRWATDEVYQGGASTDYPGGVPLLSNGISAVALDQLYYARSWRLLCTSDPASVGYAPAVGELVLGQMIDAVNPDYPLSWRNSDAGQRRHETDDGVEWVYSPGPGNVREVTVPFSAFTTADGRALRDLLMIQGRGGAIPCVMLPTDTESDAALFGRIGPEGSQENQAPNIRTGSFTFRESPNFYLAVASQVTGL